MALLWFTTLCLMFISVTHCFQMFDFEHFKRAQLLLKIENKSEFSNVQNSTIRNLGLKLMKAMQQTSAPDCLKFCKETQGCIRTVHCRRKSTCLPGTFCLGINGAGTCYLAAKTGKALEIADECYISEEVKSHIGLNMVFSNVLETSSVAQVNAKPQVDTEPKQLPEGCRVEPTYINQGAVRKQSTSKPGFPVVIEYECDQQGKEPYKYVAGTTEAKCDEEGKWTLSALVCIPTSCYLQYTNGNAHKRAWYAGDENKTENGRECQVWLMNSPHSHHYQHKLNGSFPGDISVVEAGNKCRDTDHDEKPWCYTTDPDRRWEFCDVPICDNVIKCGRPTYMLGTRAVKAELIGRYLHVTYQCEDKLTYVKGGNVSVCDMESGIWTWADLLCQSADCFFLNPDSRKYAVYAGNVSTTVTGRTCQRFDHQTPHSHEFTLGHFPGELSLEDIGNKCRDTNEHPEGVPWCYTMDPKVRWEKCPVPECDFN